MFTLAVGVAFCQSVKHPRRYKAAVITPTERPAARSGLRASRPADWS
jgi:hypothetical protein